MDCESDESLFPCKIHVEDRNGNEVLSTSELDCTVLSLQVQLESVTSVPISHQVLRCGKVSLRPEVHLTSLLVEDKVRLVLEVVISPDRYPPTYLQKITDQSISFYEVPTLSELGPGVHVWDAGWALALFFKWRSVDPVQRGTCVGQAVLELGAGPGVVGLTLAQLGARVMLTDLEPCVLDLLRLNVKVNRLTDMANVAYLDFGDKASYSLQDHSLVVAADVLYNDPHGKLLSDTLNAHVPAGSDTTVYLAYLHRGDIEQLDFFITMFSLGFSLERFEDAAGQVLGAARGETGSVYDCGSFAPMCAGSICEEVGQARFSLDNSKQIQIFRITRAAI